nr:MAG TPA: hypothetical protein [Caudoviricetes sp.]
MWRRSDSISIHYIYKRIGHRSFGISSFLF